MKPLKITDIVVRDNRQRRTFNPDDIAELSRSIQNLGLLHPVVVRQMEEGVVLVAGERRLRACTLLAELDIPIIHNKEAYFGGTIPHTFIETLSEDLAYEAELEENIIRVDLSWQERASAIAKLHELRSNQAVQRGERQTVVQTASEIVGGLATSNDAKNAKLDIVLAKHLADPEIAKASSRKEAIKVLEKKAKQEHRAKLAQEFDITKTQHIIHNGDAFDLLPTLADASINCLCTDPPYGVDASNFGSNFSTAHTYEDNWDYFVSIAHTLATEGYRVLKPNSHAYVFCSFDGFLVLRERFALAGFKVWPQPLIWSKGNGNAPWITKGHKRTYECILFASKGEREVNTVKADVLAYPSVSDREHGAEKPVSLLIDLLGRSTNPGDVILDPFAGSGSIFPAADAVSCRAIGFERDQDSFNLALTKFELL